MNIGDFDTCVKFEHHTASSKIFSGQHCLIGLSALPNSTLDNDRNDLSLKHLANFLRASKLVVGNGFCMPASCSVPKVVQFLNEQYLLKNDLVALGGQCRDINDVQFEPLDYFAISLFSIFALLITASTIYDIIKLKSKNPEPNKLLSSFSVYTNGYKLFDITKSKSSSSINCLHGLRGMSILWIILGHRITNQYPWGNTNDFIEFLTGKSIAAGIINAHTLAVDTFFVMGALLMTWSTLRDCEKKQLNIPRMIWRRYIRYTPIYAALILSVVSFSKVLLKGPFYSDLSETCVKNWWLTLLHVQNYLQQKDMCLNHGWYLSADFQLFIISPFIIFIIHKYGKKFLIIPALLFLSTIIYLISISIVYDIGMPAPSANQHYLDFIYFPTHSRAGPWFVGIILGYYLFINQGRKIAISKIFNGFMWIFSLSVLFSVVFLQLGFSSATDEIPRGYHITFLAFHRNLWGVALCWIIFACQNLKTGGIIRWFLSLPQWQPISRMGLSMYLVGAVYQVMMILNQRVPLYLNVWQLVPILLSDVFMIIILSTITYLAFEAPNLVIEDYIYKKFKNIKK
ncbi:nose resistant to fluoxetine protein 6-like [Chironomus tepperi]|uniref:nose resistant to fluoxetine protein 6-like n=1 Tax=Chironomus tepperi TaxID=113505 RepID=UPI00391F01F2